MLQPTLEIPTLVTLPNALQQLEMIRLVTNHLLLLDGLLLVLKTNQRQLPVEIVLLFQQPIQLPQQQLLAKSPTVRLELSNFV